MKTLKFVLIAVLAGAAMGVNAAMAQNTLQLETKSFREVEIVQPDGSRKKELAPTEKMVPGDEVIYVTTYRNVGKQPAESVVITNPVPEALLYKAGSANGERSKAEVSVDGGKQYGELEKLTVKDADGKARPATAADVTHLRWAVKADVAPGAEGKVTYRATIK